MNIENNKLIAEFMGWEIHPTMSQRMQRKGIKQGYRKLSDFMFVESISYHSDLNWLMEVVDKIESLGFGTKILGGKTHFMSISTSLLRYKLYSIGNYGETKKDVIYNTSLEFIKWYKEQK